MNQLPKLSDLAFPGSGYGGMTLRDYFAAKAMQGLLASRAPMQSELADATSVVAALTVASYKIADAMLEERNKTC